MYAHSYPKAFLKDFIEKINISFLQFMFSRVEKVSKDKSYYIMQKSFFILHTYHLIYRNLK